MRTGAHQYQIDFKPGQYTDKNTNTNKPCYGETHSGQQTASKKHSVNLGKLKSKNHSPVLCAQ